MKESDYNNFVDLMKKLCMNFKGFETGRKSTDTEKMRLYFDQLKKYKFAAIERGIDHLIAVRVYKDFPVVGQISQAVKNSKHKSLVDFSKEEL